MRHRLKSKRPPSAFSTEHYEEFRARDDVARFWYEVRAVPRRTDGRTHKQYERYYLGIYLLALAEHDLLPYPLKVLGCESPDFMLTWPSGEVTGLEVTRATDQTLQEWLSRSEKEHPEGAARMFSPLGYAGDRLEKEWCDFARPAIQKKIAMLDQYRRASRYDLLLADDTRAGAGERRKVLALLAPWARDLKRKEPRLGVVSTVVSLDILYDIGGESRILPYVHWSAPGSNESTYAESLSERAELAGRVTVERAVREPSQRHTPTNQAPLPGYYVDVKGRIVKRTSDGRRFEIRIGQDGAEVIVRELPVA
jgi:hypothetical protein